MLAFRFVDPKVQYVFVPVGIVSQHHIDGDLTDTAFWPHRNVDVVYKRKRIEWLQRPCAPTIHFFHHAVCNIRNLFMRELETINIFDGGSNVTLAYTACIHGQHIAFNGRYIALIFLYNLWLKLA